MMKKSTLSLFGLFCVALFLTPPSALADCIYAADFAEGTAVVLTAEAAPGSRFFKWTGDFCNNSVSPTCSFTMPGIPVNINAVFHTTLDYSWGHSDSATEPTKLPFSGSWTCSGIGCTIFGSGDDERVVLDVGGYIQLTNCIQVGVGKKITLVQSAYKIGQDSTIKYRAASTQTLCESATWDYTYTIPFWTAEESKWIGIRIEK